VGEARPRWSHPRQDGVTTAEREERARLRKGNRVLREERELLRKRQPSSRPSGGEVPIIAAEKAHHALSLLCPQCPLDQSKSRGVLATGRRCRRVDRATGWRGTSSARREQDHAPERSVRPTLCVLGSTAHCDSVTNTERADARLDGRATRVKTSGKLRANAQTPLKTGSTR
jgi:hypothetical protein